MEAKVIAGLVWLRRRATWVWVALVVYALADTFPHGEVQDWVGLVAKQIGRGNVYKIAATLGLLLAGAGTWVVVQRLRRVPCGGLIGGYWLATLGLVGGAYGILTVNNTELVHYVQYFIPGAVMMALTLSAVESLSWVLLVGGLDEAHQCWVMHGTWGVPYDFNDVTMDLLGGALGVLFVTAFLPCERAAGRGVGEWLTRVLRRPAAGVLAGVMLAGVVLFATGKIIAYQDRQNPNYWFALSRLDPQPFWFFDETWGPKKFHTLSPAEGPLLLFSILVFYCVLDAKLRVREPQV